MAVESELKTCRLSCKAMGEQLEGLRAQNADLDLINERLQEQLLSVRLDSEGLPSELDRV